MIHEFFSDNGFSQSTADPCVHYKFGENGNLICIIWVDDIIVASNLEEVLVSAKNLLKNRFKMKDLGKISYFLGIHFTQEGGTISMNQSSYLRSILKKCGMEHCKPRASPCELKPEQYYDGDEIIEESRYR